VLSVDSSLARPSPSMRQASSSITRAVAGVLGPKATVRLLLPAPEGRFMTLTGVPPANPDLLSELTRTKRPATRELPDGSKRVTAGFPLLSRGEVVGVLEIQASEEAVQDSLRSIKAIISQSVLVLKTAEETTGLKSQLRDAKAAVSLARSLIRAKNSSAALEAFVSFFNKHWGLGCAGWEAREDRTRLSLKCHQGLEPHIAERLQEAMPILRRFKTLEPPEREAILERFADLTGVERAAVIDGGEAAIVIGGDPKTVQDAMTSTQPAQGIFREVLRHLALVAMAEVYNERMDLAISWTAHELRQPLVGTRAIVELLLRTSDEQGRTQDLLQRSRQQLDLLSESVDSVLRLAVGEEMVAHRTTDLGQLLREAAESCTEEESSDRVAIRSAGSIQILADAVNLRGAIANVLRSALWHSPKHIPVEVDLVEEGRNAVLTIKDQGPRISAGDRELIFDALGRGTTPRAQGKGLGLFIARRVVEAHGGTISATSEGLRGVTFRMELPLAQSRRHLSAS
jgi:signal transduction histidine kinase